MENKYYTPSPSEFSIGFEYEAFILSSNGSYLEESWLKIEADRYDIEVMFDDAFKKDDFSEKYRVKYLDREDIESFGWKLFKQGNVNFFTFRMFTNDDIQMHVSFGQTAKIGFSRREGGEFSGFSIKNKSELRKLMQMLNIE